LITAQELLVVLRRIEARGRHETAHRIRALAGRVLRYAVATGRAQHDVAADLKDALAPVKSRNFERNKAVRTLTRESSVYTLCLCASAGTKRSAG